ncbi:MAG: hypothetical protein NC903_00750 [Candidatus Omnitrophica bacterium]|nr:hypothetical protein [Candidatus Omnitrophota bacterium]
MGLEFIGWDIFDLFFLFIIITIYLPTFILSLIFTLSIKLYQKIEEIVAIDIIPSALITPLDRNITTFNEWMIQNHKIVGPIMVILSFYNLSSFLKAVNFLRNF